MKALVTGASSGIGQSVAKLLVKENYEVYGIGRDFSKCEIHDSRFHPVSMDLLNKKQLDDFLKSTDFKELSLLINNAGTAYYGLHESVKDTQIQEMTRVNLEIPMLLTGRLLKYIRDNKGTIINIASISGTQCAPHAACYAATKAGLIAFSKSLFEENRKHDVKVTCIIPDLTDTNLYRNADFMPDSQENAHLTAEEIAETVQQILHLKTNMVCSEIILRPQYNRIVKKTK